MPSGNGRRVENRPGKHIAQDLIAEAAAGCVDSKENFHARNLSVRIPQIH